MSGVVEHFEHQLGPIDAGWAKDASGVDLPFQVARFGRDSRTDSVTFATLGFHRVGLVSRTSGRHIHQEFVMTVPASLKDGAIPGLLQQVAIEARSAQSSILRGDVIGPRGPLFHGSNMEALYATVPTHFPDGFADAHEGSVAIAIVWLVPISAGEAQVIRDRGWQAFEDLLVETQVDVIDPGRAPLV